MSGVGSLRDLSLTSVFGGGVGVVAWFVRGFLSIKGAPVANVGNWFVYVALVLWSQRADDVPPSVYGVPGNLNPTRVGKIELNRVKATRPSSVVDKVSGVTSYGSPPGCS